jgi:hypothetical protein
MARKLLIAIAALTAILPSFAHAANTGVPTIASPAANTLQPSVFRVTGTAPGGYTVQILDGARLVTSLTADSHGAWAASLALDNGAHSLAARSIDGSGSVSAASAALPLTVDHSRPELTITTGNGTVFLPPTPGMQIDGTVKDAGPASGFGVAGVRVRYYRADTLVLVRTNTATCTPVCGAGVGVATWEDEARLPSGQYVVIADATDISGNVSIEDDKINGTVLTAEIAGDEIITDCTGEGALHEDVTCVDHFDAPDGRFVSVLLTHGNWHDPTGQGAITLTWLDASGKVVVTYGCAATGTTPELDATYLGSCNQYGPKADTYTPGEQTLIVKAQATNCPNAPAKCVFHGELRLADAAQPV